MRIAVAQNLCNIITVLVDECVWCFDIPTRKESAQEMFSVTSEREKPLKKFIKQRW